MTIAVTGCSSPAGNGRREGQVEQRLLRRNLLKAIVYCGGIAAVDFVAVAVLILKVRQQPAPSEPERKRDGGERNLQLRHHDNPLPICRASPSVSGSAKLPM